MPLNIDPQQILLHLFNLVLLFGILYVLLYKPVHDFMDKREEEYAKREKSTKDALDDAEKLKAEYEEKILTAQKETAMERAKASAASESEREKIISDAHERADKIVSDARDKAQAEHDRLIARAQSEIAEYVSKAAEKIVMREGDIEDDFDTFFESQEVKKDNDNG
ncbi:MAG: ATP synthase F0 subunit B [Lachnospiraceae bacterium]|nr:ATP synthase F0 subunit B [Lachnospiraceae bacterium]